MAAGQRTSEWIAMVDTEYHNRQFRETYRSTVAFCDWMERCGYIRPDSELHILDMGSGQGANIYYMGQRYPGCSFVGVDINPELIEHGNRFFEDNQVLNCRLEVGDVYSLPKRHVQAYDGMICLQVLSWMPENRKVIEALTGLGLPWITLSSLFYEGPISCTIDVTQHDADLEEGRKSFYNIYSLPAVEKLFEQRGYTRMQSASFEIDIDLPKPPEPRMGTYTERLQSGSRLQRSGPLLMPWYFVGIERSS